MQDGRVTVQARLRQDLEALRNVMSMAGEPPAIIDTPAGEYAHRMRMSEAQWLGAALALAAGVDYANFAVAPPDDPLRQTVYLQCWGVLRTAL
jgi:hypothetical protein